jgi:hypothetical protein
LIDSSEVEAMMQKEEVVNLNDHRCSPVAVTGKSDE